jgi:glycosyltransferase involved in cell wall biosynthesis
LKVTIVLGPFQPMPPLGMGAVEKVWWELSREFARRGAQVTLIGKDGGGAPPAANVRLVPMKGFAATGALWRDLLKDLAYTLQVARRIEPADVVVTNSFWAPVVLGLARRRAGAIVVHVARFPKRQMLLYGRAAVLQAISSAVAEAIVAQAPSLRARVKVVGYPVDLSTYRPPDEARRYEGSLTLLYVGRVHPEKGITLLIDAFRQVAQAIPRAVLRIVGPAGVAQGGGGEDWLESLRQRAQGLPVTFVGALREPAQVAAELQRAHCFCYPSLADRGEAFGLAVLEAMATGLPVAVSDLGCFRDFVVAGENGVVFDHRAGDPGAALAAALMQVLADAPRAREIGERALQVARGYATDKVAQRYLELFEAARA